MIDATTALNTLDLGSLGIVNYPHPVLRVPCARVAAFDERLAALAERMLEMMHAAKGVGLAAPQVNVPVQLFVMNHSGQPSDNKVFVNPEIRDQEQVAEAEEGCLSIPGVHVNVRRAKRCRIVAQDLAGQPIELEESELPARIWQHETDHLNGVLILDRMGPTDKIATRKALRQLEQQFAQAGGGS